MVMTRPQKLLSKTTEKMILKESKRKLSEIELMNSLTPRNRRILDCFQKIGDCYSNKRLSEITRIHTTDMTRCIQFLVREKWLEKFECTQCCQTVLYRRLK